MKPQPSPSMLPSDICLTAAGLSVFPSFVKGVFASRECVQPDVEKSEAGDTSSLVTGLDCQKGVVRPKAMRTGLARLKRGVGDGRIAVRRSMMGSVSGTIGRGCSFEMLVQLGFDC